MEMAPLDLELSESPSVGKAYWLYTEDCVRLRISVWQAEREDKGTIFFLPGRTEYGEKYGRTVSDFYGLGYSSVVIDWRGQGLSERDADDPMLGHISSYDDYQKDVAAMFLGAEELDLPKPWYMVGFSMGACIGQRSLRNGLDVNACAFTGPMWDIKLSTSTKVAAWFISWVYKTFGFERSYAPKSNGTSYIGNTAFEDNVITNDPDMYEYFLRQLKVQKQHQIGGPSMGWLLETLRESHRLSKEQLPETPTLVFYGEDDTIVDTNSVDLRMGRWKNGKLIKFDGAKHDLFTEVRAVRNEVTRHIDEHFQFHKNTSFMTK